VTQTTLPPQYGQYALLILLLVNLLNYIDRQVIYAVFPLIKTDLHLSDAGLGFLGSAFMICYMISAPFSGWLGDRMSRVRVASCGLIIWSLATVLSGFASVYQSLIFARTAVGVGEASFGTVSPGLLSDYFPRNKRSRILSCFYLAIPVGSAFGYLLGGIMGEKFGWQSAFLLVGIPGLILAIPVWCLKESKRVGSGEYNKRTLTNNPETGYVSLLRNRSFVINTLTMASMTFALGGLAQWIPTFLCRIHNLNLARANTMFGVITVLAGITGTLSGGWIGDYLQAKSRKGYLLVSGWGFLLGIPIAVYALLTESVSRCMVSIFFAEFFLFLNTGPLNTVIVNVTQPAIRSMAFAVNIFFIHALGDAISPAILGWLSDLWGLRKALLITPITILLAAFFSFLCTRFIERDSLKVEG